MQLVSGVYPFPVLERVTLARVNLDGRVYLMHLLFYIWVDLYLTSQHLFACLGELPAKGPPRWWISLVRPSRRGALFALRREWTM